MKKALAVTPATHILDDNKVEYTLHKFSSMVARDFGQEAAQSMGQSMGIDSRRVFKTIIFTDSKTFFVAISPVDHEISTKKLAQAVGVRTVHPASKDDAQRVTGYVIGGISPFGQKKSHTTVLDDSAWSFSTIYVSGGRRGLEIELTPSSITQVLGAIRAPISARDASERQENPTGQGH